MRLSTQDYIDIQQLYARYAFSIDLRDVDTWMSCFTQDGSLGVSPEGVRLGVTPFLAQGPEQLRKVATDLSEDTGRSGFHWHTSPLITANAEGATGKCYHYFLNVPGSTAKAGVPAYYVDDLRKVNGEWLFRSRVVHFIL